MGAILVQVEELDIEKEAACIDHFQGNSAVGEDEISYNERSLTLSLDKPSSHEQISPSLTQDGEEIEDVDEPNQFIIEDGVEVVKLKLGSNADIDRERHVSVRSCSEIESRNVVKLE